MAPPKRTAESRFRKERVTGRRHPHRQYRKRPDISRRGQTYQPIAVRKMVYRLLSDKHNQERGARRVPGSRGFYRKMREYENARDLSYDSSPRRDSSPSIEGSEYARSVATSVENLSEMMEATNSSGASSSENSSVSNISVKPITIARTIDNTRALLKKKSLVQVINNYIRAGIAEGKRQAKKYIRKALSFGVNSGYLIPTDSKGQVIRVSPMLIESRRGDAESRKRRRKARRGEDQATCDVQRRQLTPPWTGKKMPRREDLPKPETSPRKKKKRSNSKSPERSQAKKTLKKKAADRRQWHGKKSNKSNRRKKSKITPSLALSKRSSSKSEENVQEARRTRSSCKHLVKERQDQRDRRAKSPRERMNEDENAREINRGSSNEDRVSRKFSGNEVSERVSIGRRKSTPSREDAPRNMNASSRSLIREMEDRLDAPNDESVRNEASGNAI